ncbi:dTDP-4-dehydrorhamnose 3,5-epimerase family protein [Methanococcoides sp. SA1]|nr:dTDP-4-dehydrorhamnose 3,5-epimerase family protein [Methanococcoides sp. SA1]
MTIEGVELKKLRVIPDERGWLMEILRNDENIFEQFGQVYLTTVYPNVVKAWHYHKIQTDYFACTSGMLKVVLHDGRKDSVTYGEISEFFIGEHNPALIKIPPFVHHGFKAVGTQTAHVISIPTEPYNYDEPDEYRLPVESSDIDYDWGLMQGLKHG